MSTDLLIAAVVLAGIACLISIVMPVMEGDRKPRSDDPDDDGFNDTMDDCEATCRQTGLECMASGIPLLCCAGALGEDPGSPASVPWPSDRPCTD